MNELLKPSDFIGSRGLTCMSKTGSAGCESAAQKIIELLVKSGDEWRRVTWSEYKVFTEDTYRYEFDRVIEYCTSAEKARTFSPGWAHVAETTYSYARFVGA